MSRDDQRPCPTCARNSSRPGVAIPHCSRCRGSGVVPARPAGCDCGDDEAPEKPAWYARLLSELARFPGHHAQSRRALRLLLLTEWGDRNPIPLPACRARGGWLELAWERGDRRLALEFRRGTTRVRYLQDLGPHEVPGVLCEDQVGRTRRLLEWVLAEKEGTLPGKEAWDAP